MRCQCNSEGPVQLRSGDYWQDSGDHVFAIGMIHGKFYGVDVDDDEIRQFSRNGKHIPNDWGHDYDGDLVKKVYYTAPTCYACNLDVEAR